MGDLTSGWVVRLQPDPPCWLAPWAGDPGRTCVEASAKRYATQHAAATALGLARLFRPYRGAHIYAVEEPAAP